MVAMSGRVAQSGWRAYLLAAIGVAAITLVLIPLRGTINSTTIGFGFLLGVLFIAIIWGSTPALFASVLAVLAFNFFFLRRITRSQLPIRKTGLP